LMTLTTTNDCLGLSMLQLIDDQRNFLDDIWRLHLAIFIAKVESCLSCREIFHHTYPQKRVMSMCFWGVQK
jgi:hypothetical protein